MKFIFGLFLITLNVKSYVCVAPSNILGSKALWFENSNKGAAWPIADGTSLDDIISHGVHCIDLVRNFITNGYQSPVQEFHGEHCRTVLNKVLHFFEKTPDYNVPSAICKDFEKMIKTVPAGFIPPYCKSVLDVNESDFDNNKATIAYHEIQASVNFTVNKDEIFTTLKGYNIANLIAKAKVNKQLTKREEEILKNWEKDEVISLEAFGIYCVYGNGTIPLPILREGIAKQPRKQF